MKYLLTLQVSRYFILALQGSIIGLYVILYIFCLQVFIVRHVCSSQ